MPFLKIRTDMIKKLLLLNSIVQTASLHSDILPVDPLINLLPEGFLLV